MNNFGKYFLGFIGLVFVGLFCWYFSSIIAYVLIAAVISFLGRPIIDLLGKVKIRGKELHNGIKAALALLALWTLFIFFMVTIIPLVTHEFQNIGNISVDNVMSKLESPVDDISRVLKRYGLIEMDDDMEKSISNSLSSLVSVTRIKTIFGSLANTISDIFVALFSITFISFFFLKDSRLFSGMVLALLPAKYEEGGRNALDSILFEVLGVMTLNTLGLWMVGLSFSNALVIGLVSGVLNVIPYIGPIIGVVFGVVVGIVLHIDLPFYTDLLPLLVYMVIAMLITQLIDNVVFQPFIYGNSVHAHPLEIFLVILLAGNLAGIPGMILAIPSYTVLRVILIEFFNKYRLVKKITQSLDE